MVNYFKEKFPGEAGTGRGRQQPSLSPRRSVVHRRPLCSCFPSMSETHTRLQMLHGHFTSCLLLPAPGRERTRAGLRARLPQLSSQPFPSQVVLLNGNKTNTAIPGFPCQPCLWALGERRGRDCLFPQAQKGSALVGSIEAMPSSSEKEQMASLRGVIMLQGGLVAHPICGMGEMDGVTPSLNSPLSF